MDNKSMVEIRDRLAMLPVLESHIEKLNSTIWQAEKELQELLNDLEKESVDVEKIKKESLATTILKFIGKYEGKLNKEVQEMLAAKTNYDKASNRVKDLHNELSEISSRISALEKDKQIYAEEFKKREAIIHAKLDDEVSVKYRQLEAERESLSRLIVETDEALRMADKVIGTANRTMHHLESAEDWATYDVWVKGGIFSHMEKYDRIDSAQEEFNRLSVLLKDFQKELSDVDMLDSLEIRQIDSTTRAIDFWFDNIFTDLNVRDKIREDKEHLKMLIYKIEEVVKKLKDDKVGIYVKINEVDNRKNDLIISQDID